MANSDALLARCKDTGETKLFLVLKSFRLFKIEVPACTQLFNLLLQNTQQK
jgi:hypothetical protein